MNENTKAAILSIVSHKGAGLATIHRQIKLLKAAAVLIPNFDSFRELCEDHLRDTWEADQNSKQRTTQTVRRSWARRFRYVATHLRIDQDIEIRALDRYGNYECRLVPRVDAGEDWRQFIRLGRQFGIHERQLQHLARRSLTRLASPALPA